MKAGDFDGRTPLHVAVCEGHEAMTDLLIKSGALIHAKDRYDFKKRIPGKRSFDIQPLQIQFKSSIVENDTKDQEQNNARESALSRFQSNYVIFFFRLV